MSSSVRRLALATLAFTLGVILWGAYVRASGSGAGCGAHWPLCNGEVVPRSPGAATLVELTHRVTSGLSLLLAMALALTAFRRLPRGHPVRWAAAAAVALFLVEALLGAGLVLFELVADDASQARAVVVGAHLVNTLLLLAALTLAVDWSQGTPGPTWRGQGALPALLAAALASLLVLGASGAIAALGDTLFPAASLAEGLRQDASPTAHFLLRLRALHPLLAVGVGSGLSMVAVAVAVARPGRPVRRRAAALVALLGIQLAFGVVNLLLLAPIWSQLVHLLLADLCLIALVRFSAAALVKT